MSLTSGSIAPFARPPGGALNVALPDSPAHVLYVHALEQRIRADVAGLTVVDSTDTKMLHETGLPARWYFPADAVRADLLEPSGTTSHCPFKGDARYWHLRIGDRLIEDAFWEYPSMLEGAPDVAGFLAPYQEKFDRWRVEDEEVRGHPRDPFHRVDARRSSAHVSVRAGGEVIAESTRPVALYETGLPVRWYLPEDDVRGGRLVPSDTTTVCPYKGTASYWTLEAGGRSFADACWTYREPLLEALPTRGHRSFMGEGISVEVQR